MANLIWDVIQVSTLGNPLKLPKNLRKTAAVNAAERRIPPLRKPRTARLNASDPT